MRKDAGSGAETFTVLCLPASPGLGSPDGVLCDPTHPQKRGRMGHGGFSAWSKFLETNLVTTRYNPALEAELGQGCDQLIFVLGGKAAGVP
jgi:hypothetical protein